MLVASPKVTLEEQSTTNHTTKLCVERVKCLQSACNLLIISLLDQTKFMVRYASRLDQQKDRSKDCAAAWRSSFGASCTSTYVIPSSVICGLERNVHALIESVLQIISQLTSADYEVFGLDRLGRSLSDKPFRLTQIAF